MNATPHTTLHTPARTPRTHSVANGLFAGLAALPTVFAALKVSLGPAHHQPLAMALLTSAAILALVHLAYPLWWIATRREDAHPWRHLTMMLAHLFLCQALPLWLLLANQTPAAPAGDAPRCGMFILVYLIPLAADALYFPALLLLGLITYIKR